MCCSGHQGAAQTRLTYAAPQNLYQGHGSSFTVTCDISEPLIKAQVAVGELVQKSPLNDAFGCLVLEEVNKDVLQTRVLLQSCLLLGELVQSGVLLVESLKEAEKVSPKKVFSDSASCCIFQAQVQSLTLNTDLILH